MADTESTRAMRAEIERLSKQVAEESDLANQYRRDKEAAVAEARAIEERRQALELERDRLQREVNELRKARK